MPDNLAQVRDMNRVRWLCRRGMKELDIIMNRYRENIYVTLPEQEQQYFKDFLALDDPDIYSWVMGRTSPESEHYATIVHQLRNMFDKPIGS